MGADDFISEPYNAQVLLARIQKVLKRAYEITGSLIAGGRGAYDELRHVIHRFRFIYYYNFGIGYFNPFFSEAL